MWQHGKYADGNVLYCCGEDIVFLLSARCLWATCVYTLSQQRSNLIRKWLCLSTAALLCHPPISGSKTVRSFRRTQTCWERSSLTRLEVYSNMYGRWVDWDMGYGFLQKPEFISVAAHLGLTVSIEARSSFFYPCQSWFQQCWYLCTHKVINETWFLSLQ